ncbi:MAG: hypothetical protein ACPG21_06155 [Crocinitomicaceae bacterium]
MKRERTRNFGVRLILMFIILTPALANAQLDTLHFIPPWHHKNTYDESSKILVVTTPSGTPVNVSVELGDGTVVATGTCTNTSDFTYNAGASSGNCGTIGDAALNTVHNNEGLIVHADKPVWASLNCNYRAAYNSPGAKLGLGTEFRAIQARHNTHFNTINHQTASIFVMASEDGTTVTFDDIKTGVTFAGTPTTAGTSDPITITLDKGESYIISAHANVSAANRGSVAGTRITSV